MKPARTFLRAAALGVLGACGDPAQGGAADLAPPDLASADLAGADLAADPQTPPQGAAALEAWLQTGAYRSWACEPAPMARAGAHGRNRVCSNDQLSLSSSGDYPVGAAAVKELYAGDGAPRGFAVSLRTRGGDGRDAWYWYERSGATTYADGVGVSLCTGCHGAAPRDYVYVRVPR